MKKLGHNRIGRPFNVGAALCLAISAILTPASAVFGEEASSEIVAVFRDGNRSNEAKIKTWKGRAEVHARQIASTLIPGVITEANRRVDVRATVVFQLDNKAMGLFS